MALTLLQSGGALSQLIMLPFLTRVLGPQEWGVVAWVLVIQGYFVVIVDWGFSWRGTSKIAQLRNDPEALSETFIAGWTVQWLLCALSVAILITLYAFAPFFALFRDYVFYVCLALIALALFPGWYPFGLERVREVALVQFAIRAGSVPLVFLLVRTESDGPLVVACLSISSLVASALGLIWICREMPVRWHRPKLARIRIEFLEGGAVFLSRVWTTFYTTLLPTVLGVMTNATAVGFYALADRIRTGIYTLISPIMQSVLPRTSYLFREDRERARQLLMRSGAVLIAITGGIGLLLFILADPIIYLAAGTEFEASVVLLRWFAVLPLVAISSHILGIQVMMPNGMVMTYNKVVLAAGLVGLGVLVPLVRLLDVQGAAITVFLCEVGVALALGFIVWRRRRRLLFEEAGEAS